MLRTNCPELNLIARGKVRDVYEVDDGHLLFVTTDRISAFDVLMTNGIPGKGIVLTKLSTFWFEMLEETCPHHLVTANVDEMPDSVKQYKSQLEGRSMLVKKLKMLPVEAIVRGYITGSGWKEYTAKGTVCDVPLPAGLKECDKLAEPMFTPSTKAGQGGHDENIHPDQARSIMGSEVADKVQATAIALYKRASEYAACKGILIADTKFEFGLDSTGQLVLGDEVLTPDSSRFWPASQFQVGRGQPSYDKQFVRDYLESVRFDKATPLSLPDEVVSQTSSKYEQILGILTQTDE